MPYQYANRISSHHYRGTSITTTSIVSQFPCRCSSLQLQSSSAAYKWVRTVAEICRKNRGSWSVRSSHRTVSGASNNWFYLPFFDKFFILDDVKLAQLSINSIERKNIFFLFSFFWGGGGSKHTLAPLTYFQGSKPQLPRIYAPECLLLLLFLLLL